MRRANSVTVSIYRETHRIGVVAVLSISHIGVMLFGVLPHGAHSMVPPVVENHKTPICNAQVQ
jgi:hypothetical protein